MSLTEKVSIIVPAYNVENYIEKCIDSLLNQTYQNIEILLVLNGTTDNTELIANQLAQCDNRIKLFAIGQSGVSVARNIAIEHCTGTYIMFLDSDDYYDTHMVERMYGYIKNNPVEMVVCNYIDVYSDGRTEKNNVVAEEGTLQINRYMKCYAKDFHTLYYGVLWNKIYIADIVQKNNIRFDSKICLGEDSLFNLQYLRNVSSVYICNDNMYYHNRNNESSLTNTLSVYDMWMMSIDRYRYCIDTYKYLDLIDECKELLSFRLLSDLIIPVDNIIIDNKISFKEKKDRLKKMINNDIVEFGYQNAEKLSVAHKIIKITRNHYIIMYCLLKSMQKIKKNLGDQNGKKDRLD